MILELDSSGLGSEPDVFGAAAAVLPVLRCTRSTAAVLINHVGTHCREHTPMLLGKKGQGVPSNTTAYFWLPTTSSPSRQKCDEGYNMLQH